MQITGGYAKGIHLMIPKRTNIRPSTGCLREAVFSTIGCNIKDKICVDLFAGTGVYGLEAISRGAKKLWFVENHYSNIYYLKRNIFCVKQSLESKSLISKISFCSAENWCSGNKLLFDFIFMNPPYCKIQNFNFTFWFYIKKLLFLHKKSSLILEMPNNQSIPRHLSDLRVMKVIGKNKKSSSSVFFLMIDS